MLRRPLSLLAAGLVLAITPTRGQAQGSSYEQLQTFSSLLNQIRVTYVDSVTYGELVHAAIDGVLSSLDPHSRFELRADAERELAYNAGKLAGGGLRLDEVDGDLVIFAIYPGGPASKVGVAAGDRLVTINDTVVFGQTADEAGRRFFGDKGTKLRIGLLRGPRLAPDTIRVSIKFDYLEPHSVGATGMLDATTGYIRFQQFFPKGGDELDKAIHGLKDKGAKRLILDLRGDPGGDLFGAIDVAGLFLPKGAEVFRINMRRANMRDTVRTTRDGPYRDLPLMVLIDEGSASASEAVAGSLQDHDRALLLGRRSFGKALMQQNFPVPPQGDMVWLTTGRIATPSGRIIQRNYHGLKAEQYYSFAGRSGAEQDTLAVFHTDAGRPVRGGGGVVPDVTLPKTADFPAWVSVAADSGWIEAIADSVANLLSSDPRALDQWQMATDEWHTRLVVPFLQRVRDRLHFTPPADTALEARIGRNLAPRAAEVRWGRAAAEHLVQLNDPDIRHAMAYWDQLPALLKGGQ